MAPIVSLLFYPVYRKTAISVTNWQSTQYAGTKTDGETIMVTKKEPTEEARLLKEMQQRGKELGAITKRGKQLMKLPARTSEEQAELDRLMTQDADEKMDQTLEAMKKFRKAITKK